MRLGPYLLGPNDENQGVYIGDAIQCLQQIPDHTIDAIIVDPPYCAGAIGETQRTRAKGQGLRSENVKRFGWFVGDNMGTAGLVWLLRNVAIEALRISKSTGSFLTFCDWRMLPTIAPAIESAGLRYQNLIVWDKGNMGLGRGFRCQHELILHFTFGSPKYYDMGTSNVLYAKRVPRNDRIHQTQKPIDLLTQLIGVVTPEDGIVVDSFVGSGSTCVACASIGRRWLGFDISPDYVEIAKERVRQAQPPLFVPEPEQDVMELT